MRLQPAAIESWLDLDHEVEQRSTHAVDRLASGNRQHQVRGPESPRERERSNCG